MEPRRADHIDALVSAEIRAIKGRRGMEQQQLAALSGVPEGTLSRKSRDLGGPWRLDELQRIAAALGVPLADLIPGSTTTQE